MTSEVLSAITEQMQTTIEKGGFKKVEDGYFKNDKLAFKINHNEEKKLLVLEAAAVDEQGNAGDFQTESSWLFEEAENTRDAASAGMDFNDTVKSLIGMRRVRTERSGDVALPDKNSGDAKNVEALCGKMLAIFPQFKDEYKAHVTKYGTFLYIDFFSKTFAVKIGEMLDQNNKKSLKKLFDCLADMYNLGDRASQNAVVGVLLGGAVRGNDARLKTALEYLEEHIYLKTALINLVPKINKDRRFKAILG